MRGSQWVNAFDSRGQPWAFSLCDEAREFRFLDYPLVFIVTALDPVLRIASGLREKSYHLVGSRRRETMRRLHKVDKLA